MNPADLQPGWQIISELFSGWVIAAIIFFVVLYAYIKKVAVYEVFVEGAKEGFSTAVMIIPYLVAIFAAIAVFRVSGALQFVAQICGFIIKPTVMSPEVLMMALMKPMSGSGARGLMVDVFNNYGVDSYQGFLASAIQGSTETTFYVIAVYLGAVGVKNVRHTITVGLIAEFIAVLSATILSWLYWQYAK